MYIKDGAKRVKDGVSMLETSQSGTMDQERLIRDHPFLRPSGEVILENQGIDREAVFAADREESWGA
jgi:hypothetical protein